LNDKEYVDGQHNLVVCFLNYINADSTRKSKLYNYNWDILIINGNILRKIGGNIGKMYLFIEKKI